MSKWIPITEREPEEGTWLLLCNQDGFIFTLLYYKEVCSDVIAWMELPNPYKPE